MSGPLKAAESPALPGTPPPVLQAAYEAQNDATRPVLVSCVLDLKYPAETLARVLTRNGHPVSASTIRTYRRALRAEGSV